MAAQEYRGTTFAISYDGDVCTHAGNCVNRKPNIFNGDNDPWINPDGGTLEEAKQAVRDCPSGALTLRML